MITSLSFYFSQSPCPSCSAPATPSYQIRKSPPLYFSHSHKFSKHTHTTHTLRFTHTHPTTPPHSPTTPSSPLHPSSPHLNTISRPDSPTPQHIHSCPPQSPHYVSPSFHSFPLCPLFTPALTPISQHTQTTSIQQIPLLLTPCCDPQPFGLHLKIHTHLPFSALPFPLLPGTPESHAQTYASPPPSSTSSHQHPHGYFHTTNV